MDAVVDVVDENDSLVRTELRSVAVKNRLLHRHVVVLLFSSEGLLLLTQRGLSDLVYPGYWESLSDFVRADETYLRAVERCLFERLGLIISPSHIMELFTFRFVDDDCGLFRIYVVRDVHSPLKVCDEIKDHFFHSLDSVHGEIRRSERFYSPVFLAALRKFEELNIDPKEYLRLDEVSAK